MLINVATISFLLLFSSWFMWIKRFQHKQNSETATFFHEKYILVVSCRSEKGDRAEKGFSSVRVYVAMHIRTFTMVKKYINSPILRDDTHKSLYV